MTSSKEFGVHSSISPHRVRSGMVVPPKGEVTFHPGFNIGSARSLGRSVAALVDRAAACKRILLDVQDTKDAVAHALGELEAMEVKDADTADLIISRVQSLGELAVNTNRAQAAILTSLSHRILSSLEDMTRYGNVLRSSDDPSTADVDTDGVTEQIAQSYSQLARILSEIPTIVGEVKVAPVEVGRACDLSQLVMTIVDDHQQAIGENSARALFETAAEPVLVVSDQVWLRHIITSLVSNMAALASGDIEIAINQDAGDDHEIGLEIMTTIDPAANEDVSVQLPLFGSSDSLFRSGPVSSHLGMDIGREMLAINGGSLEFSLAKVEQPLFRFIFASPSIRSAS
ncbi:hypothetical protein [Pyruvatibacter sp.]|uniref:hypothetical protein n=1 Tax=Pyruvatibacter sp. TaxID=1981328 RepID=UPI003267A31B